jgi:hypothetical protein
VYPFDWLEAIPLVPDRVDDALDFGQRHAVHGLGADSWRHRSLVGIQTPVGQQEQPRIEQLSIQSFQR